MDASSRAIACLRPTQLHGGNYNDKPPGKPEDEWTNANVLVARPARASSEHLLGTGVV